LLRRDGAAVLLKCRFVAVASKRRKRNVAALGNHWASKVCLADVMSVKLLSCRLAFIAAPSTFVARDRFAAMPRNALQICRSSTDTDTPGLAIRLRGSSAETSPSLLR
jgi:hypothetical protein